MQSKLCACLLACVVFASFIDHFNAFKSQRPLGSNQRNLIHSEYMQPQRTKSAASFRSRRCTSLQAFNPAMVVPVAVSTLAVAVVVAIHEMGHLLAAKLQGMKVISYNIGYGPKLIAFNDSSNTEFALRAVPLGGYVAFPNNYEIDEVTGEITGEIDDPDLLQNRPPLQRALVISAGVIANILLTFSLAFGTAFTTGIAKPVFNNGVVVTKIVDPSSPASKAGLQVNDIITRINNDLIDASESSVDSFVQAVRRTPPGATLELEILRSTEESSLTKEVAGTTMVDEVTSKSSKGELRTIVKKVTPELNTAGTTSIGAGINARITEVAKKKAENPLEVDYSQFLCCVVENNNYI